MATKKITQKDMFNEIIALAKANDRQDIVEFAEDRIEKLSRKSENKKPTKAQVENESIKDVILEVLSEVGVATATAIATDPRVGVSNQKVTALLRQLKEDGKVVRSEDKGKAYFSLPSEDVEE